jgi:hypothetical protein
LLFAIVRESCVEPNSVAVAREFSPVSLEMLDSTKTSVQVTVTYVPLVATNFRLFHVVYALAMANDVQLLVPRLCRVLLIQGLDVILEARPLGVREVAGSRALLSPIFFIGWVFPLEYPETRLSSSSELPSLRIVVMREEPSLSFEVPC